MRRFGNTVVLISLAAAGFCAPHAQGASLGSIRGFVKDGAGAPLAGALVFVLGDAEAAKPEKLIKRARTDVEGKFVASGINPGRYLIKAEANGYSPVEVAAVVKANKATIFDSILLRRSGTLAQETSISDDSKYAARARKATIFHFDEEKKYPADGSQRLADSVTETHGYIAAFTQRASGEISNTASFTGANFAISQRVDKIGHLLISGQTGHGSGAPQRLQAMTSISAGDRHQLAVTLGYGRLTLAGTGVQSNLGQVSVSARDTWQLRGPFIVVYGLEFSRFTEGASGSSIIPRFGITADAGPRTRLFAGVVPGSSVDTQSQFTSESGEVVFPEPRPVAMTTLPSGASAPKPDRSFRLQFGGEQILSESSSVEMMAFIDTVSGSGVGLLAIPLDGEHLGSGLHGYEQNGVTRGVRVVYRRHLAKMVDGSVGYAVGEGQQLDPRGLSDPASLFARAFFQVLTAKLDVHLIKTGTRISTVYRLAPGRAVFAIDPFQGRITTYDPNVSLLLTQELPTFNLIPGQLTAVVDVRNLLDQQTAVSDEQQELISTRCRRLVRVGVALRF